eukprot:gnl/MRDRNA2_/MRDRNA2_35201_c0_seq1.p1 gnl/MRDRNA2_/MRDRNA2_35201_c0~~gnl/MRDRNA2_/MRDRNA2_35201_c0_seq1.p1  ORF type:complete len:459 (+),score=106.12 gnl/MRDRNA2_/MRDRNA2_35201_c0_seq1:222-1598(+)
MSTKGYIVNALLKLSGQNYTGGSNVDVIMNRYRCSRETDLQQRCNEFQKLSASPGLMRIVCPFDASCEDLDIDTELPFLNDFVSRKRMEGCREYSDPGLQVNDSNIKVNGHEDKKGGLNFTAYAAPSSQPPVSGSWGPSGYNSAKTSHPPDVSTDQSSTGGGIAPAGLNVSSANRKWGPQGYNTPNGAPAAPPPSQPSANPMQAPVSTTAQPAPTPASKAPEPPKPKELTEKEKMAAALFTGLAPGKAASSATPAAPKWGAHSVTAKAPSAAPALPAETPAPAPPPPAPEPAEMMDLLDLGGEAPSAPSSAPPAPPPAKSAPADDMLDMLSLDMPSEPAQAAPTQSAPSVPAPILVPLQITTAQVGQTWASLANEKKLRINTTIQSVAEMMQRLQRSVNVHPVEIIGVEGIAAGQVGLGGTPCYLHGKLQQPFLDMIVRGGDAAVVDQVMAATMQACA